MTRSRITLFSAPLLLTLMLFAAHMQLTSLAKWAYSEYTSLASPVVYDRNGTVAQVATNSRDQVCLFASEFPAHVQTLVLRKEDQWFYYHPGIHPYRSALAALAYIRGVPSGGASTITQQLAKTLLDTTDARTPTNKLRELILAFSLEYTYSKDDILTMYLNTVPLGGNIQGVPAATRAYFGKQAAALSPDESLQLIAALSNPSLARPLSETNLARAVALARQYGTDMPLSIPMHDEPNHSWLELAAITEGCDTCTSTLDLKLNERIRALLAQHLARNAGTRLTHGAVAVVDVRTGELIALVGSPDPSRDENGMRINMALETRPIGSTIKPFLYLFGFMKGVRPYTEVEDREYKFQIEKGFPLYPKNYDGTYRGTVTLEQSLANSLNVPTVEVLRYTELNDTYRFFEETLGFRPPQPWDSYAYGIALGGLELDLVTLTHAFTAFGNGGDIVPLVTAYSPEGKPHHYLPPHSELTEARRIAPSEYIDLIHAILRDRTAGVEQFGQNSNLHLSQGDYGVKTGTSRDYHDSWTVGYTADYAVGVWAGNAENTPTDRVSGSSGAGAIWHDVMELLFSTPYYSATPIETPHIVAVETDYGYSYGLATDDVDATRALMRDTTLLQSPHEGDTFLFSEGMRIPLVRAPDTTLTIDSEPVHGDAWYPRAPGRYTLVATRGEETEESTVYIEIDMNVIPR